MSTKMLQGVESIVNTANRLSQNVELGTTHFLGIMPLLFLSTPKETQIAHGIMRTTLETLLPECVIMTHKKEAGIYFSVHFPEPCEDDDERRCL